MSTQDASGPPVTLLLLVSCSQAVLVPRARLFLLGYLECVSSCFHMAGSFTPCKDQVEHPLL